LTPKAGRFKLTGALGALGSGSISVRRIHRGFTLVELLVVIGIIAVLISILLPTITGARRQARLVQCGSNLRQLVNACLMHAQEHKGYLPLAGDLVMPPDTELKELAWAVSDVQMKRYTWVGSGTRLWRLGPFVAGLAVYLGVNDLPFDDVYQMDQVLNDREGVWKRFLCPDTAALERGKMFVNDPFDQNIAGQGMMMDYNVRYSGGAFPGWWAHNTCYAFNEGVFGFHYDERYLENRLRGNLARVRKSSEVALFTDGNPRKFYPIPGVPCGWITWTPSITGRGKATLGDAFAGNGRVDHADSFDMFRHGKRMNVGFADGHVETVKLTKADLDNVYIVAPD
jgi:prepilin-type N-terminal cleavage/methylation domain-containing protein/prepilin-type processing-associated H-X9-DG protein